MRCAARLMGLLLALFLVAACGAARDPVLDGVGMVCSSSAGCPAGEVCLAWAQKPPKRCWGARENGQNCPEGGAELAWGIIPPPPAASQAWYACSLRCYSDSGCLNGLRCHTPDQICLP
jgi:hypothetical protein